MPGRWVACPLLLVILGATSVLSPAVADARGKHRTLAYPEGTTVLTRPAKLSRWAFVEHRAFARERPSYRSKAVARLRLQTSEYTDEIALVLEEWRDPKGRLWARVRLPIRPNGSTGWVRRGALGNYRRVRTWLKISRRHTEAVLRRGGKVVFRTRIGIGRSYWPTPRGQFYIRSRVAGFNSPVYGPIAFGTNARSPVLTDWPGGGMIGIHGTNEPSLIPGRISHGCIRMRNHRIRRLARLMPVGTPLTIR